MATQNMFPSVDNEARNDVVNQKEKNYAPSSVFPFGRSSIMTMNEGFIYPVDTLFVLPTDKIDIDFACYLESLNPFVDRMYSGMKLAFHAFYQKAEHIWKGWRSYSTRGRRGNISLSLPYVEPSHAIELLVNGQLVKTSNNTNVLLAQFSQAGSLLSYLVGMAGVHVPNQSFSSWANQSVNNFSSDTLSLIQSHYLFDNTQVNRSFILGIGSYNGTANIFENATILNVPTGVTGSVIHRFNALPFAMYQYVYRDFYLNQNLVKDNPGWFPDDDDDFAIPYSASRVDVLGKGTVKPYFSLVPNNYSSYANDHYYDSPVLCSLRCRQWSGDPFTTCVPFLERNGTTSLMSQVAFLTGYNHKFTGVGQLSDLFVLDSSDGSVPATLRINALKSNSAFTHLAIGPGAQFPDASNSDVAVRTLLSLNQLRELSAATLWSERNARAKGDYNSLIEAHYGYNPRSVDRSPIYLGGSVQRLSFNDVVSSSTTDSQPLGTLVSRAASGGSSRLVSNFVVPDFGYVMICASLVPDTYYSQGVSPEFDASLTGSELPWPEFANLQKENVLLKRLFYTGADSIDNKLIGYNERFLNFKYRPNRLLGHMIDYADSKFRSLSYARYFDKDSMANFNSVDNEFVTLSPYNSRYDMYTVPSQPHFVLQFGDNIRLVRALPFASKEMSLSVS